MKLKGIDGDPHKRWSMWFNSKQREEPYQVLTSFWPHLNRCFPSGQKRQVVHGCRQLVSWDVGLSPATSATPIFSSQQVRLGTLERLPGITWRKVGTTSNHHAPYDLGDTRATMAVTEWGEPARGSKPQKGRPSSDCSLQPDYTKLESLVIANQNVAVNTFPGLVHTARHTMGVGNARSLWLNRKERAAEGRSDNWGEVVTR